MPVKTFVTAVAHQPVPPGKQVGNRTFAGARRTTQPKHMREVLFQHLHRIHFPNAPQEGVGGLAQNASKNCCMCLAVRCTAKYTQAISFGKILRLFYHQPATLRFRIDVKITFLLFCQNAA
jgi:hypothetical protein